MFAGRDFPYCYTVYTLRVGNTVNFGIDSISSNYSAGIADINTNTGTYSLKMTDSWMILYFCLYWLDYDNNKTQDKDFSQ